MICPDYAIVLSQLEHSDGHGRSAEGAIREGGKHLAEREAAVEPNGERDEVSWQVLGADVVIAAMQRALDVAEDRIDPGQRRMLRAGRSTPGCHELFRSHACQTGGVHIRAI